MMVSAIANNLRIAILQPFPCGGAIWSSFLAAPYVMISCACLQANRDNDVLMWFSHGRSLASFAVLSYVSYGRKSDSHVRTSFISLLFYLLFYFFWTTVKPKFITHKSIGYWVNFRYNFPLKTLGLCLA